MSRFHTPRKHGCLAVLGAMILISSLSAQVKLPIKPQGPSAPDTPEPPQVVNVLQKGELYVLEYPTPLDVSYYSTDGGEIALQPVKGPLTVMAPFAGGTGDPEVRQFNQPCIYVVTHKAAGTGFLVVVPYGFKEAKEKVVLPFTVGTPKPPTPPPPPVDDTLTARLRAAYDRDGGDKAREAADLAKFYRNQVPAMVNALSTPTCGELLSLIVAQRQRSVPGNPIPNTRDEIAAYLDSKLPKDPKAPLTDPIRGTMIAEYVKVAQSLEKLR